MGRFVKGDIVVVPFPFSDLSTAKKRPAYIAADLEGDDLILIQVTSKSIKDEYSIQLEDADFIEGKLNQLSNIRPNRVFTADKKIILYKVGHLKSDKVSIITDKILEIFK